MIKSTKLERAAIEARLRDALAIKGNSDIESTLNTIIDYNNVEEIFLRLHAQYEYLFIVEYHNRNTFAGQYKGSGAKYDLEHHRVEFIKSFNELAELFSNVVEVQRQKRKTDQIIDTESKGAASIVRGGKNHGVHISASAATAIGKPVKLKSVNCLDCGKKLAFSTPGNPLCNSCFLKTLVYVCQDCKQTFSPSDINQKTCVSCQSVNLSATKKAQSIKQSSLPKCTQCKQPLKRNVHPFLCNKCSAIIAGVAVPNKPNFIQRFFFALAKML